MRRCISICLVFVLSFSLILIVSINNGYATDMIQIKGSDTLINLVQRLSEVYIGKNKGKVIAVTGGGSGTGIAALINGKCDIANASRLMKDEETAQATKSGVDPKSIVIAIDGLSVITNGKNPVTKLTVDEIGSIFRGEIRNWKELGGKDIQITLYGRQSNSGTFVFFRDIVLKGDYSDKMNRMNGNSQIVESIKQDVSGIGYVGIGYVKDAPGITVIKVAPVAGAEYVSPLDPDVVQSGKYPIARPLNQYTNGMPNGAVRDFIAFELSEEGQKIVGEEGFFPLSSEYMEFNKKSLGL